MFAEVMVDAAILAAVIVPATILSPVTVPAPIWVLLSDPERSVKAVASAQAPPKYLYSR